MVGTWIAGKLTGLPWLKVAAAVALVVLAAGMAWAVRSEMRDAREGQVEEAARAARLASELKTATAELATLREAVVTAEAERNRFMSKWEELRDRPPEVVEVVREVVREIPAAIVSTECELAAIELLAVVQRLDSVFRTPEAPGP